MKTRPWIGIHELNTPNDPSAEDAILAASSVLFALSGQKFGGIQQTTEFYTCDTNGSPVGCVWDSGSRSWWNESIGMYTYVLPVRPTRNAPGGSIRLRGRPVQEVLSVSIGGVLQDPLTYEVHDRAILVPTSTWGLCSTPEVTYTYGVDPPALGRMAARRLANELILATNGSSECSLPANATSVSRQGLTLEIFDPQAFFDKGHTGLYEVDLFVATVNPSKAKKRPAVFSPDIPRARRRS